MIKPNMAKWEALRHRLNETLQQFGREEALKVQLKGGTVRGTMLTCTINMMELSMDTADLAELKAHFTFLASDYNLPLTLLEADQILRGREVRVLGMKRNGRIVFIDARSKQRYSMDPVLFKKEIAS